MELERSLLLLALPVLFGMAGRARLDFRLVLTRFLVPAAFLVVFPILILLVGLVRLVLLVLLVLLGFLGRVLGGR